MSRAELEEYLLKFGSHALAYSALQRSMAHFTVPGVGYIPYAQLKSEKPGSRTAYVLSNPICSRADYALITEKFILKFPRAAFVQATEEYAEVLDSLGLYVNELGYETEISLKDYSFSGRIKEDLRRGLKRVSSLGTVVEELSSTEEIEVLAGELREVSREWMKGKTISERELSFVARPAQYSNERGVRKFIARLNGRIEGFVFFDPMYKDGRVFGYHLDIIRARRDAHPSTRRFIIKSALELFKSEGRQVVSLGISPELALRSERRSERFKSNALTRRMLEMLYKYGNAVYPFKNLTFAKSRYGGGMEDGEYRDLNVKRKPVYFAHCSRLALREMYGAGKLTGVMDGFVPTLNSMLNLKPPRSPEPRLVPSLFGERSGP